MTNTNHKMLTQLIREEVKRQLQRLTMSKSREDYINRLLEPLIAALGRHYRMMLANQYQQTDRLSKWRDEFDDFMDELSAKLEMPPRAKDFDVRKAMTQALNELMEHDRPRRRYEQATFQESYQLRTSPNLPDDAHKSFHDEVWTMVDLYYPPSERPVRKRR